MTTKVIAATTIPTTMPAIFEESLLTMSILFLMDKVSSVLTAR